jgi:hypothetical protein
MKDLAISVISLIKVNSINIKNRVFAKSLWLVNLKIKANAWHKLIIAL